jgi:hypothetical protein
LQDQSDLVYVCLEPDNAILVEHSRSLQVRDYDQMLLEILASQLHLPEMALRDVHPLHGVQTGVQTHQ